MQNILNQLRFVLKIEKKLEKIIDLYIIDIIEQGGQLEVGDKIQSFFLGFSRF